MFDAQEKDPSKRATSAEDEAAAWVLKGDRSLTPSEQDELSSWLAADPRHSPALSRARSDWKRLDKLGRWRPEHSAQPNPDLLAPAPRKRGWPVQVPFVVAAIAASITLALVWFRGADPAVQLSPATSVSVAPAVTQRLLEDGSIVELNQDAVLTVNFTPGERRVRLQGGEAYFSVSKDPTRPFIVTAGELDVRAIGTAFNVRLRPAGVNVLVAEGHVQLTALRPHLLTLAGSKPQAAGEVSSPVLKSKQQAEVSFLPEPTPLKITTLSVREIDAALAWQHRLLDFNALPLRDVVTEFNRRNHVQIILMDAELGATEISASFRSDNIDGFLRLLEAGFEARVERRGESEILVYRRR